MSASPTITFSASESAAWVPRSEWPHTFRFGEFVRLTYHPELWGRIVGPADYHDRWIFEFPTGARITNGPEAFTPFEPNEEQRRQTSARFVALAANFARPRYQALEAREALLAAHPHRRH